MADRSIVVRLRAEVAGFKREMAEATKAVDQTAKGSEDAAKRADTAMGRMVQSAKDNRQAWDTAGSALTGFGAATLGGLTLATKAAMDWQSAFAGVRKTVDASEPEFTALEAGLRGMARELPASHQEIAAVAEAAGQLGIATPNILGFTRTMIDMGEATNLSAEEAATSLARFMNVMGTSQSDVGRLGASVVGLGNNFATTEAEIVEMSQRLSGAGAQAKLTEGDVLGIATAMSSVGIEAEAGGSAMSLTMKRIGKEVDSGGEKLELFAQVAGMSAEQFATAWREDPAMALDAFITGLSGVEAQGMTTNGVLAELGITGIRESDALLRLSAAAGQGADGMSLLAGAVQMGNDEFDKGTALIDEANQRYQTAESRIKMAKNAFIDAGISLGGTFLPVVATAADAVADFAGYFGDLPGPIHAAVGGLAGITGAASLVGGAFLLTFPRVMDTVSAFRDLAEISPRAASGIGKAGRAAGVAAAAFVALTAAGAIAEMFSETAISAEEMSSKLANLAATAVVTAEDIDEMVAITGTGGASVKDFGYALDSVNMGGFMKALDTVGSGFGIFDSDVSLAKEQIASLDQALATFAMAGTMDHLAETFNAAVESAAEYGYTAEDIIDQMPGLQVALEPIATQMGLTADNTTLAKIASGELVPVFDEATGAAIGFADGMDGAAEATQSAADAADAALSSMQELANEFIAAERGVLDYADALDSAAKTAEENGKHWEDGTQAARDNKNELLDLADQAWATADALAADNKSGTFLAQAREDLIDAAIQFGATREEAEAYADSLGLIPEEIEQQIELDTEAAEEKWAALWEEQGLHPPQVPVGADTDPAKDEVTQFSGTLGDMPPGAVPVTADTAPAEEKVWGWEQNLEPFEVIIDGDTYYGEQQLRKFQGAVNEAGGTVEINGSTMYADEAFDTLIAEINAGEGTVMMNGTPVNAESALLQLISMINGSGGVVEIDGDAGKAWNETGEAVDHVNASGGTIDIDGNASGANAATDSAKRKADRTEGTIDVNANTSSANSAINSAARDRTSTIRVTYSYTNSSFSAPGAPRGNNPNYRKADGGPIYGPGTGRSDSVPILASNGEHMLTAAEVALAGGHDSVYRMRAAIRAGALRFADGGGISPDGPVRPAAGANSWAWGSEPSVSVSAPLDHGAVTSIATTAAVAAVQNSTFDVYVGGRSAGQMVKVGTAHNGRTGG